MDKDEEINELTKTLQLLQADFENYKKRVEKEKEEYAEMEKIKVIRKFMPLIDNFELAVKYSKNHEKFKEGIMLLIPQAISILERMGIKRIPLSDGKDFNPSFHEAIIAEYSTIPKDKVIDTFQSGYIMGNKIIRHSKVKVSKGLEGGIK